MLLSILLMPRLAAFGVCRHLEFHPSGILLRNKRFFLHSAQPCPAPRHLTPAPSHGVFSAPKLPRLHGPLQTLLLLHSTLLQGNVHVRFTLILKINAARGYPAADWIAEVEIQRVVVHVHFHSFHSCFPALLTPPARVGS